MRNENSGDIWPLCPTCSKLRPSAEKKPSILPRPQPSGLKDHFKRMEDLEMFNGTNSPRQISLNRKKKRRAIRQTAVRMGLHAFLPSGINPACFGCWTCCSATFKLLYKSKLGESAFHVEQTLNRCCFLFFFFFFFLNKHHEAMP